VVLIVLMMMIRSAIVAIAALALMVIPIFVARMLLVAVIGHGLMLLLSIAKWRDSLNSQSLVYDGDRQAPPDLLNLLPEGTDSDPDTWVMHHKSIPAFPCRNTNASSNRRSFGSKKILLEEFVDTYQIQRIWNSHVLTSNALLVRSSWYSRERSIQPDILDHVESYVIHALSLFSCFFTSNQIKSMVSLSSHIDSLLLPS
jgi:hypothetical protein